jgi:hypothetical protein
MHYVLLLENASSKYRAGTAYVAFTTHDRYKYRTVGSTEGFYEFGRFGLIDSRLPLPTGTLTGPHLTEARMGSTNVEVFCTCTVIARKYLLSRSYVAVNHIGQEITVLARGCKRGEISRDEFLTYLTWQKEQIIEWKSLLLW